MAPTGKVPETATGLESENRIALTRLFEEHRTRLVLAAQRVTHNKDEAEDVVQEAAIKALVKLQTFRGELCLETWVWAIVSNCAIGRLRNPARRRSISLDSELVPSRNSPRWVALAETADPEQNCLAYELSEILRSEMEALKAPYRTVLRLCDVEGWSYFEVSAPLNLKRVTLKGRLYRGRRVLQERWR
jgi:RNA polymerase sigma-70 factor, ECF subfamily